MSWLPTYHDMGLVGGVLMADVLRPAERADVADGVFAKADSLAAGHHQVRRDDQRRAELRLRPVHRQDHRRPARGARPELRGRSRSTAPSRCGPRRCARFTERFGPYGFRPRDALSVLRHGRDDADRHRQLQGPAADRPHVRRPPARRQAGRRRSKPSSRAPASWSAAAACCPTNRCGSSIPKRDASCRPTRSAKSGSAAPAWPRAIGTTRKRPKQTFQARIAGTSEGPFLRTGDLGFIARRRAVRHRPPQGLDHRPRRQSLSAGHRDDGRTGQRARFSRKPWRPLPSIWPGRERLIIVAEVERTRRDDWSDVIAAVRKAVTAEHELPPDAVVLVRFGSIPKTSSGKIQRHACREEFLAGTLQVVAEWRGWETGEVEAADRAAAAPPQPPPTPTARQGRRPVSPAIAQIVMDHVRAIAKERAKTLTLDTQHRHRPGARFAGAAADRQLAGRDVRRPLSRGCAGRNRDGPRGGQRRSRRTSAPSRACSGTSPRPADAVGQRRARFRPNATTSARCPSTSG